MNDKFLKLDQEKRDRIINAAMQEFAEQGYDKASTNKIVKQAGIGKGMLFYYFENKQTLYHYLLDYGLDMALDKILNEIDTSDRDFIERMYKIVEQKLEIFKKYPDMIVFIGTFMLSDQSNIPDRIVNKYEELQKKGLEKAYKNIDYSLFREDLDVEKVFKLIEWTIDGYQNEIKARFHNQKFSEIDLDPYRQEFYDYLAILKRVYYQ
ncbi:TetR/AcrR family transcriptional regulator [Amphibacillus cookii]|uniref:TetR/AcrR family transcriptional regulator n=1 Tax=Amphibacillus cookii TaxID=767787 RepID=UPI00195BD62F|nr:TetR/AcrR family transcriptional regulator [Amphibacillus cookii]MBM7543100.1 AcrR family transcriptional regulator [Amphibacillus cookii]